MIEPFYRQAMQPAISDSRYIDAVATIKGGSKAGNDFAILVT